MGARKADKAGSWYRGDAPGLRAEIERCLERAEERYGHPRATPGTTPVAIVVPHAGLAYSGAVAATAYRLIRDAFDRVDAFVVFGACHRARLARPAVWPDGEWRTPLGPVEVDAELAAVLIDQGAGAPDEEPHLGDNAIELQTPFIKHLFPEAKIVPIAISPRPGSWRVGETSATAAAATGKTVVAAASTDLTHYGAAFGVMPAGTGEAALEWTRQNDRKFLKRLIELDLHDIAATAERDGSACGGGAAEAVAGWAKARGCRRGRLLAHTNSHEIMPRGEAEHLVGYASLVFEAGDPVG